MGFTIPGVEAIYPFEILVGLGYVSNVMQEFKFGYNPDLAAGTREDVWDFGGEYTYSTTADIDTISSSSALDTQKVVLSGLDENYNLLTVYATLNGQNKVTFSTPFLRLWRMVNIDNVDFAGSIYAYVDGDITAGIPDVDNTIRAYIEDGNNQTLMLMYTIPKGYTGVVRRTFLSLGGRKTGFVTVKYWARPYGMVFQVKGVTDLAAAGTSATQSIFKSALIFPEMTDFKVTALGDTLGLTMSGDADICLHRNI